MRFDVHDPLSPKAEVTTGHLVLKPLWAGSFALLFRPAPEERPSAQAWFGAVQAALEAAKGQGAQEVQARVSGEQASAGQSEALRTAGFQLRAERIEYGASPADLPGDEGSPMSWSPMPSMDLGVLASTAELIRAVAEGDPDVDPSEDTLALLTDYLTDRDFDSGPDAVHMGLVGEALAALVIAQVKPGDGWGRITYMGLLPAFRGQGLGAWVHRHGFAMLKAQGAKRYQGGTLAQNLAMRRLFERHGCQELGQLQEWSLKL